MANRMQRPPLLVMRPDKVSLAVTESGQKAVSWTHQEDRGQKELVLAIDVENVGQHQQPVDERRILRILSPTETLEVVDLDSWISHPAVVRARNLSTSSASNELPFVAIRLPPRLSLSYNLPGSRIRKVQVRFAQDSDCDQLASALEVLGLPVRKGVLSSRYLPTAGSQLEPATASQPQTFPHSQEVPSSQLVPPLSQGTSSQGRQESLDEYHYWNYASRPRPPSGQSESLDWRPLSASTPTALTSRDYQRYAFASSIQHDPTQKTETVPRSPTLRGHPINYQQHIPQSSSPLHPLDLDKSCLMPPPAHRKTARSGVEEADVLDVTEQTRLPLSDLPPSTRTRASQRIASKSQANTGLHEHAPRPSASIPDELPPARQLPFQHEVPNFSETKKVSSAAQDQKAKGKGSGSHRAKKQAPSKAKGVSHKKKVPATTVPLPKPPSPSTANAKLPSEATSSTASASWVQNIYGSYPQPRDREEDLKASAHQSSPTAYHPLLSSSQEAMLSSIGSRLASLETSLIPSMMEELKSHLQEAQTTARKADDKAQKRKFQDMMSAQSKVAKEAIDAQYKAAKGAVEAYGKVVREWVGREC
ncbi:MAG: hypothetical protein M1817_000446 [Caeruleum heppii]|nr:MAG: hypothetical protein M1817_000446 [Caeruleum heppii]